MDYAKIMAEAVETLRKMMSSPMASAETKVMAAKTLLKFSYSCLTPDEPDEEETWR